MIPDQRAVGREYARHEVVNQMVNKAKGEVISEFEKVCPSENSLKRMVKEMHNIFDQLSEEIKQL
jgi:ASC-1-like (ASCH) protein